MGPKKEKPDFVFSCRKCGHEVYCGKERIKKMLKYHCPECGEESESLWILEREGDFSKIK